ncbi:MAG TPA: hypothetical protein VM223_22360 [Planctomycetota bacterium]|nr:hypothetical protein [Planctomycetota bacterium]
MTGKAYFLAVAVCVCMVAGIAAGAEIDGHIYGIAIMPGGSLSGHPESAVATLERLTGLRFDVFFHGGLTHGLDLSPWWAQSFLADVTEWRTHELERLFAARPAFVVNFGGKLPDYVQAAVDAYAQQDGAYIDAEALKKLPDCKKDSGTRDDTHLWAMAFERMVYAAMKRPLPTVTVTAPPTAKAGEAVAVALEAQGFDGKVTIVLEDRAGKVVASQSADVKQGEKTDTSLVIPANVPADSYHLRAKNAKAGRELGCTYLSIEQVVRLTLSTEGRHGQDAVAAANATIALPAGANEGEFLLRWVIRDFSRGAISCPEKPLPAAGSEPVVISIPVELADPDPRAYVCWVQAVVERAGVKLAEAEQPVYRWRPFNMRDQVLLGSWHVDNAGRPVGIREQVFDYLKEIGLRSATRETGEIAERAGFRATMEHDAMTVVGLNVASFNVTPENREQSWRTEGAGRGQRTMTSAVTLLSMGEETGYAGNWSTAYPWAEDEAPERPTFWFREYLRFRYKTIDALNASWGTAFKDWAEVKYLKKYAYPNGWLFVKPAADVEANLAPYVDTHAFAEWWVNEYVKNYTTGLMQADPAMSWSKSFEFTFVDWSPIPMTHFCSSTTPHGAAMWHAYSRMKNPNRTPYYHLNWGFYEDPGQANQFWLQGIIAGATYLDNWGELFNWDLTYTRASVLVKDLAERLKPAENLIVNAYPADDSRIGIFIEETPWRLCHGRPGYFLKGRGPNAQTYGPLVESPPCASWLASAEGPLYAALTAAGYSPKYITPSEIAACKIIFLPYTEALSRENAARLREFVNNGGVLVALPKLAEYDENGWPYPDLPGAGIAELLGISVQGDWIGRDSIVALPGHDESAKILYEYYSPGQKLPAEQESDVLSFNFPSSYGGHPVRLISQAHQAVKPGNAKVLALHEDNEPAITWRKQGKGTAIFLNVLRGWPGLLYVPTDFRDVAFAYTLRTLAQYAGVEPECWFETMNDNAALAVQLAAYHYRGPNGIMRIVGVFNDWRVGDVDTRFIINTPVKAVYDVLSGEQVPLRTHLGKPCAYIHVGRGSGRMLALLPYDINRITVSPVAKTVQAGEPIELTATFAASVDKPDVHPASLRVFGPDMREIPDASRNMTLSPEPEDAAAAGAAAVKPVRIPTRVDGPAGTWRIVVTDCATRTSSECTVSVTANPAAAKLPAERTIGWPSWRKRRIDVGPAEFEKLLDDLAAIYADDDSHPTFACSFYVHETSRSRHRIGQLLAHADWRRHEGVVERMLGRGKRIVLTGEDLGLIPATGDVRATAGRTQQSPAVPLASPTQLAALDELVRKMKAQVCRITGLPDVLAIQAGKGWIIIDRRSIDREAGWGVTRMNAWLDTWRRQMRLGRLLPGQPSPDPKLLVPQQGGIDLKAWFLGKI